MSPLQLLFYQIGLLLPLLLAAGHNSVCSLSPSDIQLEDDKRLIVNCI